MAYRSFEELDVWQRACRQSVQVYTVFKSCTVLSLKDQIERAGLSVPSNIAEGCERNSNADFCRFLRIALGSNAELRTQLYIAKKLNLLEPQIFSETIRESREVSAMISGLCKSLTPAKTKPTPTRKTDLP